jgi:hypothetical protein
MGMLVQLILMSPFRGYTQQPKAIGVEYFVNILCIHISTSKKKNTNKKKKKNKKKKEKKK